MALPHTGSWGTPDFGVTETIGSILGAGKTAQGGSNLTNKTGSLPTAITNSGQSIYGPGLGWYGDTVSQNTTTGGGGSWGSNGQGQGTQTNTSGGSGSGGSISDAQYDALGVARGDVGGYERVLRELQGQNASREDQLRGEINSGYDQYFGMLDSLIGDIPNQQRAQEGILNNTYDQGISNIRSQEQLSLNELGTSRRKNEEQQVKTLNDLSANVSNLFRTGQVALGARGAADSSAANQYSYAITKLGNKGRGDVLSQTRSIENDINDREARLKETVTSELSNLESEKNTKLAELGMYFNDKRNELMQKKAAGQLDRSQSLANLSKSLLDQSMQYAMQIDADYRNRRNALFEWATGKSENISQLRSNLSQMGLFSVPEVGAPTVNGQMSVDAQGNMNMPLTYGGYSGGREDEQSRKTLANLSSFL